MSKAKYFLVIFVVIFAGFVTDATPESQAEKSKSTKQIMTEMLIHLTSLKKYLVSEEEFVDPKNSEQISSDLKALASLTKRAQHDPVLKTVNYKFSRHVLEQHVADTERTFRLGKKSFARWQLMSSLSVCMSCHTQVRTSSTNSFEWFREAHPFSTKFEQAEFLFAIRSFEDAMKIYDTVVDPKNGAQQHELETAILRQLTYFLRIQGDPEAARAKMAKVQKIKKLPEYMKLNISAWLPQLDVLAKQNRETLLTDKEIVKFAASKLEVPVPPQARNASDPNLVQFLYASGIFYEFLSKHPDSKAVPDVLYALAVSERTVGPSFFYSLADLYLRECITRYPEHPVAKKCFKELNDETIFGYTGSRGTDLPPEVQRDLNELRKIIETKGKTDQRAH